MLRARRSKLRTGLGFLPRLGAPPQGVELLAQVTARCAIILAALCSGWSGGRAKERQVRDLQLKGEAWVLLPQWGVSQFGIWGILEGGDSKRAGRNGLPRRLYWVSSAEYVRKEREGVQSPRWRNNTLLSPLLLRREAERGRIREWGDV